MKNSNGLSHIMHGSDINNGQKVNGTHSGINFRWKDYRSSFCQMAIDKGAELQAVSKVMGHSTTATTESYYGRIKDTDAIREIERVLG
jgi:site-specific recombinase XerD